MYDKDVFRLTDDKLYQEGGLRTALEYKEVEEWGSQHFTTSLGLLTDSEGGKPLNRRDRFQCYDTVVLPFRPHSIQP